MKLAQTPSITATFIALGLSLATPPAAATAQTSETRPNVVVILTDDQDVESLPVMRNLMSYPEGSWVQFNNAFTNVGLCSPSRVTLLTGLYAHHHNVVANHNIVFDETNTLPVWLDNAGYYNGIIGRYHNTQRPRAHIPGWDYAYSWKGNRENVDIYSTAAVAFIESAPGPFFLYLAYPAPHQVAKPPTRYRTADVFVPAARPNVNEADMADKPRPLREYRPLNASALQSWQRERVNSQRELLAIDDGVQWVMDALKAEGVLDNTIIIFSSDNGFSWGSHRIAGKHCPYEECNNVPLLIRYPGATNRVESRLVSNVDLTATIADIAGVTPGLDLDGRSLRPLLEDTATSWPEAVLLERHEDDYFGVRTPGWTYVEYASGEKELYDLAADPYQMENVAGQADYAAIEAGQARQLRRLLEGYAIGGTVATAAGQPIAGALISAGPDLSTHTDAEGHYLLEGLPEGSYTLTATRSGYRFAAPGPIPVPPGGLDKNFTGEYVGFTISGTITTGDGRPLAGVRVADGQGHAATSGSDGSYALPNLSPGDFVLTPALTGYAFSPVSRPVTVNESDVGGQDFAATLLTYDVSGSVTLDGSPMAGVTISAGNGRQATTDANGAYVFHDVPAGSYTLSPARAGYAFAPASRTVTVSNSDVGGQDFAAALLVYDISGLVTLNGNPMAGVAVSDGHGHQTTTNAAGAFLLPDLLPGTYTLTPARAGYIFAPVSRTVTVSNSDVGGQVFAATLLTYDVSGSVTLDGGPLSGVTISAGNGRQTTTSAAGAFVLPDLPPGTYTLTPARAGYVFSPPSLAVTVSDSDVGGQAFAATLLIYDLSGSVTLDGSPLVGVAVSAGNGRQATSDDDGAFRFADLPIGTYTLTPALAGYAFTPVSRTVTVNDGDVGGQDFAARLLTYAVSGSVTLNGSPLAGVVVSDGNGHQATTSAAGAFVLPDLLPGTYTLTPVLAGHTFTPASRTVTVGDDNVSGQNFMATLLTYSISGVTAVDGIPRAGMVLLDGQGHRVTSESGGVYRLSGLLPGTYRLTPYWRGVKYSQYSLEVVITDSDVGGQNINVIMR